MNKIIGSGLISKHMVNLSTDSDCLIIGAGVSNSNETRVSEFAREAELIESVITANNTLRVVYFSTCSVNQENRTPYINHKLAMENIVSSLASEWCVYRLPQVVGLVNNTTLISYFVRSVLHQVPMTVQANAYRYLIDIEDVVRVCGLLLNSDTGINTIQSISPSHATSVVTIVERISLLLGKRAEYELVKSGESYEVDLHALMQSIGCGDKIFAESYWCGVLDKYIPLLRNLSC
ncbi:NAD-dependent epimerase/dehydratase family protein [Pseudomonas sp. NFACC42-2]|uniref:NAD-dependent epimerase/dehydratase family protein n=1 Tax=Pseudomonas sp. NFACC42-2 TaxID=1566193 RepID=UPI0008ED68E9|nr:NAD-dependent epimerase/dehydratase family protein [Pseudomonas sp. NFACC42-2]SFS28961.1 NAD dependent epimerase/dehydratase family protein [Pseudomonas sp. NFACC42-2]